MARGHWFFDFGTDLMAGLELEWNGGNATINLRASEELITNTSIKFPMRTGNAYEMQWTAGEGTSSFEQHEYWEFRYGEIKAFSQASGGPAVTSGRGERPQAERSC